MNEHEFINRLKQDMEKDIKLMPEIPMNHLVKILFQNKQVSNEEVDKKLISFRDSHGVDCIISLPNNGQVPTARFWLKKENILLNETNEKGEL